MYRQLRFLLRGLQVAEVPVLYGTGLIARIAAEGPFPYGIARQNCTPAIPDGPTPPGTPDPAVNSRPSPSTTAVWPPPHATCCTAAPGGRGTRAGATTLAVAAGRGLSRQGQPHHTQAPAREAATFVLASILPLPHRSPQPAWLWHRAPTSSHLTAGKGGLMINSNSFGLNPAS